MQHSFDDVSEIKQSVRESKVGASPICTSMQFACDTEMVVAWSKLGAAAMQQHYPSHRMSLALIADPLMHPPTTAGRL
jgi:hypothetical protein